MSIDLIPASDASELLKMFNQSIFNDLSWTVKLLLLKDMLGPDTTTAPPHTNTPSTPKLASTTVSIMRRVPGIQFLVARREEEGDPNEDENNMRLKLFRLMYETVRDSDLKCKRAELIRTHYANSSVFEIGYLMGDLMDKFNIMSDISMTLKRLFHDWKPIEHINAYEQIANQAIEINHLIDIMRSISKKNDTNTNN